MAGDGASLFTCQCAASQSSLNPTAGAGTQNRAYPKSCSPYHRHMYCVLRVVAAQRRNTEYALYDTYVDWHKTAEGWPYASRIRLPHQVVARFIPEWCRSGLADTIEVLCVRSCVSRIQCVIKTQHRAHNSRRCCLFCSRSTR